MLYLHHNLSNERKYVQFFRHEIDCDKCNLERERNVLPYSNHCFIKRVV